MKSRCLGQIQGLQLRLLQLMSLCGYDFHSPALQISRISDRKTQPAKVNFHQKYNSLQMAFPVLLLVLVPVWELGSEAPFPQKH